MNLTIIIATYNSAKTIEQCLESILKQDYTSYQIIIKDGGSTDNTLDLIGRYTANGIPITLISSKDTGVYNAWNMALETAKGKWVTFLGSDDYFSCSNTLSKIRTEIAIAEKDNYEVVYGKNNIVSLDDQFIDIVGLPWAKAKQLLRSEMSIRHPGCFCSLNLLTKLQGFDESFLIIGDYDFTLSASMNTEFHFYDFPSVNHRVGGLSISPSRMLKVIKETIKLRKKHKISPSLLLDKLFFKRTVLYALSLVLSDKLILKLIGYTKKRVK